MLDAQRSLDEEGDHHLPDAVPTPQVSFAASAWNAVTSFLTQIGLVFWHLGWHLLVLVTWIFPYFWDGKHYFYLARHCWAPGLLKLGRSTVTFAGRDRIDWSQPHVIVANHQGNTDIPLLFMLVPRPLRFLAKRSVGYIPVLGWMLRLAGFPLIDRQSARKGRESIDRVAQRIREDKLVVAVFPEGTRTPEGTILAFKKGAFVLAIKAQVPILPIAIEGSGNSLARGAFRIYPSKLKVTVGEPIPTAGLTERDRDAITAKAEAEFTRLLGWRRIKHTDLAVERARDRERRFRLLAR